MTDLEKATEQLRKFGTGNYGWCSTCGPVHDDDTKYICGEAWHNAPDSENGACAGQLFDYFPEDLLKAIGLVIGVKTK